MQTQAVIAGDVWPTRQASSISDCFGLTAPPELFIWTLDCAIPAGAPREKRATLPFNESDLASLRYGKTTLAVTASNHLNDFGDAGVDATLAALEQHGMLHVGAGRNQSEANRVSTFQFGQHKLIVLAFAETLPRVGAIAAAATSGGVRPLDRESCLQAIREARKQADWVWVVLHWGNEFIRYPDPEQRQFAREMVEAGATLVVASHTHVALGYEKLSKGYIFYGLGNFMFPNFHDYSGYRYRWHPTSRRGTVLIGNLIAGNWDWEPIGVRLDSEGIPHRDARPHCPNYAENLPNDEVAYRKLYGRLARASDGNTVQSGSAS